MDDDVGSLKVIIPVGGIAKRLQPLTAEVSKAVVRFLNRPIVELTLISLARQGIRHFIFGVKGYVNYRSLHDYYKDGVELSARYRIEPPVHIKYQPHVNDVGSADAFRIVAEYYDVKDTCAVVQGDNIFDLDVRDMLEFHNRKRAVMTIGLTQVQDVTAYGIADLCGDLRIKRFVEKPQVEEAPSNYANTGVYLLSPEAKRIFCEEEVQRMIHEKHRLDFGRDFIPYLVESGYPVYGYLMRGDWLDLGTPEGYLDAMLQLLRRGRIELEGRIPEMERVWIQGESDESMSRRNVILNGVRKGTIHFEGGVLIGRHCRIGEGARIRDSSLDNFSIVGERAVIERSAIMDRAIIQSSAEVRDSIIGRHVVIHSSKKEPTRILNSVIGDDVIIGPGCEIASSKVYPHTMIPPGTRFSKVAYPMELFRRLLGPSTPLV